MLSMSTTTRDQIITVTVPAAIAARLPQTGNSLADLLAVAARGCRRRIRMWTVRGEVSGRREGGSTP